MDYFREVMGQRVTQKELLLISIQEITSELVKLYKTSHNQQDQEYIFHKLKEIYFFARKEQMNEIENTIFDSLLELTRVN